MTTAPLDAIPMETASDDRQARLQSAVARLRTRAGGTDFKKFLLIGGAIGISLGLILIVWGWYGAAHSPFGYQQMPYMISGGLLGLALVFAGGFFYFAYWLTEMLTAARKDNAKLVETLASIESLLAAGAPAGQNGGGAMVPAANSGRLVATVSGTMLHRPDCSVVANREGLRDVKADAKGFTPCKICDPLGLSA
jgi:hypothetical protein